MLLRIRRFGATALIGVGVTVAIAEATHGSSPRDDRSFMAESESAMTRMMAGMHIRPSGDADRDFATMMIAHHQGAIAMARAELGHGRDRRLLRIAQGIIVEQQQEIEAMHFTLRDGAP
jgi:uncharacterized protein (DUF305 family)